MSLVLLVSVISLGFLTLLVAKDSLDEIQLKENQINRKESLLLTGLMLLMIFVVLDILLYQWVIPLVALIILLYRRELYKKGGLRIISNLCQFLYHRW